MNSSTATWRNHIIPVAAAIMVGFAIAAVIYGGFRLGSHLLTADSTDNATIQDRFNELPATADQDGTDAATAPAVLYEVNQTVQGQRHDGSVSWRTETTSSDPKIVIRADARIPDRQMSVSLLLRRNTDTSFPASHVIELKFSPLSDPSYGEISAVPGMAMKPSDQASGARLTVQGARISPGFFLVALSDVDTDMDANLKLLKEQSWLMIPIVYSNGSRAMLNFNKGPSGERAFNEAFASWGE